MLDLATPPFLNKRSKGGLWRKLLNMARATHQAVVQFRRRGQVQQDTGSANVGGSQKWYIYTC